MVLLNQKTIEELVNYKELITVVEQGTLDYEAKKYTMPDRISVFHKEDAYLYMPCFSEKIKGTKVLTLYPENSKQGEAIIQGVMLMNNTKTGKISHLLEGATITAFRTGAVGAMGIKHTTPANLDSLGIVGAGVQAYYQALFAADIRPLQTIYLLDRTKEKAQELQEKLTQVFLEKEINVIVCEDARELLQKSKAIITTTTSPEPVLPDKPELLQGKHFVGIGSYKPHMREYPKAIFSQLEQIFIDVEFAKEETGDLVIPLKEGWFLEEKVSSIGELLKGEVQRKGNTTFFKSVGMAAFDVAVADYLCKKAEEKGMGIQVDF